MLLLFIQHVFAPSNVKNLHCPIVLSVYLAHLAQLIRERRQVEGGSEEAREGGGEGRACLVSTALSHARALGGTRLLTVHAGDHVAASLSLV